MSLRVSIAAIVAAAAAAAASASAQTYTWTGAAGDGRWSTPANWVGNARPIESPDSTIDFVTSGFQSATQNDLGNGFDLGTLNLGGTVVGGNSIRVHKVVDSRPQRPYFYPDYGFVGDFAIETVGDVSLFSGSPAPAPGSPPQTVALLRNLTGTGTLTLHGGWRIDSFGYTGALTIADDASLTAYPANGSVSLTAVTSAGIYDVGGIVRVPAGQVADLSAGVVDLGRGDNTLGTSVAAHAIFEGDVKLGDWFIHGYTIRPNVPADRIDVSGTLDLRQSHVLDGAAINPDTGIFEPYVTLASYGNRLGALDITSIAIGGSPAGSNTGLPRFPIIYTSAENSGPGEIRVLLPEPSSLLTVAGGALLGRRRRRQSIP